MRGLKLSKEDDGSLVDPKLFKMMVGSLMYLTTTSPDIIYGVSLISRFMESPEDSHWQAGKRILRYVCGTKNYEILYSTVDDFRLIGNTNNNCADSIDDRKSTSGYAFNFGSGVVSWASKKQPIVTLSSTEVEYVAATVASCQVIWMRRMLAELMHKQDEATKIYYDNNSAIALSKKHIFHKRSKHIDTRYHFIRELVNNKEICLEFCRLEDQFVDIFTKPLARDAFEYLRSCLGVCVEDECSKNLCASADALELEMQML